MCAIVGMVLFFYEKTNIYVTFLHLTLVRYFSDYAIVTPTGRWLFS